MTLPARRMWVAALAAATTVLMVGLLVIANLTNARAAATGSVQRCATHFCVDGKTAYFAGANSYDLFTFGSGSGDTETQYMDKAAIDSEMANMASDGVTLVRTWMFSHETWHGFEPAKNTMNEQQWAEFDYILYSANQHGLRVVPALENYWTAYGGVNSVLGWEGASTSNSGNFFDSTKCAALPRGLRVLCELRTEPGQPLHRCRVQERPDDLLLGADERAPLPGRQHRRQHHAAPSSARGRTRSGRTSRTSTPTT